MDCIWRPKPNSVSFFRQQLEFIDNYRPISVLSAVCIEKLRDFGITGTPKFCFSSYLFGRFQQVSYDGILSSRESFFYGVPPGSILRPLLFLLHLIDSATVLSKCKIAKYADDTVLSFLIETSMKKKRF